MKDTDHPISLFSKWFNEELKQSKVRIPSAVCLSTIGTDSFPNARFVSFKEVIDHSFVITGPLNSRKGTEISKNNRVALTFWWTETERQVRVQGLATQIPEKLANRYFKERNVNAQAVSSVCSQGREISNLEELEKKVLERASENSKIPKPKNWSGFLIKPLRIEFMEFKKTRFHHRKLYELEKNEWSFKQIEP